MESFASRLKRARMGRKLAQPELAERIGLSKTTISHWETGKTEPEEIKRKHLEAAARVLYTNVDYLLTGRGAALGTAQAAALNAMPESDESSVAWLELSLLEISAGPGRAVPEYVEIGEKLPFSTAWLRSLRLNPNRVRLAKVVGASMEPTLVEGDMVLINEDDQRPREGRVYALVYGNDARVKRLYPLADERLRITSDNADKKQFHDEYIDGNDIEERVTILGRVVYRFTAASI